MTGAAQADDCRDDLTSEREGMITMHGPATTRTVTSREALGQLGEKGERATALTFRREVDDFWRRKVKRSVTPTDLTVRYQISGNTGPTGFLAHTHSEAQRFPIRILAKTPEVLCEDRDFRIISGGFTLIARAGNIGLAGFYSVEIDVDVEER